MATALAIAFLALLTLVLLLNFFALPANWIFIGLAFMWFFLNPAPGDMSLMFFAMLIGLAVLGETIEYAAQWWGSKKYGSTTGGMFAGLVGAFAGAIIGLPFLLGFGALIGAFIGAWGGCYLFERIRGRSNAEAFRAARGALVGRFLGIIAKCAIGIIMLGLVCDAVWPPEKLVEPVIPVSRSSDITAL